MFQNLSNADIFIPDGTPVPYALKRTTHLGVGAHQDDLEFMALHGILECFQKNNKWFGGITCSDGAGSARIGDYAHVSDSEMIAIREKEQRTAATIGQYSFVAQLRHPSKVLKESTSFTLQNELASILKEIHPDIIYTHSPADKHMTHIAVFSSLLKALRTLPQKERPKKLIGCEAWRDLDWLPNEKKIVMDVSKNPNLASALNGVFDSQIAGGKRYDLGVTGRRLANATFFDSHTVDSVTQAWFGIDLTPLILDDTLNPVEYMDDLVSSFAEDIREKLGVFFF